MQSSHSPSHEHSHHKHPGSRQLHKDWRLWVAVFLMLIGILTYVMTLDESMVPFGRLRAKKQPAATVPAALP